MMLEKGGIILNSVMLVGRLAHDIEVKTLDDGKEVTRLALAVNRNFKNTEGIYEVDYFDCILWDGLAKNTSLFCKKGDTVGIRGRLQTSYYEKDEVKHKVVEVIAEKITFLSSKKVEKTETESNGIDE